MTIDDKELFTLTYQLLNEISKAEQRIIINAEPAPFEELNACKQVFGAEFDLDAMSASLRTIYAFYVDNGIPFA